MGAVLESVEKLKIDLPNDILAIHKMFVDNGKKLYVVGGAVRDAILGRNPKDFDLATDALPDETIRMAKENGMSVVEVGKSFGVVIINGHEIATFREDIGKGRRPDAVSFTDIRGDVKRRDLTVNALFYDIEREEIVDLVGGIDDIKNRRVRAVGVAEDRFDEDPLRKLRALRFAGALGGDIHVDTLSALRKNPDISGVSSERIRDEFLKSIRKSVSVKELMKLADELEFLPQIFPNLSLSKPYIESKNPIIVIAYLLRENDVFDIKKKLNKLTYSSDEVNNISFLISLQEFTPDKIVDYKKSQKNTTLSNDDIIEFADLIGMADVVTKIVNFELSVSGKDVDPNLKGKTIGDTIRAMETDKFLSESNTNLKLNLKPFEKMLVIAIVDFMKRKMDMNPQISVKRGKGGDNYGDVSLNKDSIHNGKFTLTFNPNLGYTMLIRALIHELTHIKQISKGELKSNGTYDTIIWKGGTPVSAKDYKKAAKDFNIYSKLPWEKEAYNNEKVLYNEFLKSDEFKKYVGKNDTYDMVYRELTGDIDEEFINELSQKEIRFWALHSDLADKLIKAGDKAREIFNSLKDKLKGDRMDALNYFWNMKQKGLLPESTDVSLKGILIEGRYSNLVGRITKETFRTLNNAIDSGGRYKGYSIIDNSIDSRSSLFDKFELERSSIHIGTFRDSDISGISSLDVNLHFKLTDVIGEGEMFIDGNLEFDDYYPEMNIIIAINPNSNKSVFSDLQPVVRDLVRHEIEHISHNRRYNLIPTKRFNSDIKRRVDIRSDPKKYYKYYLLPKEVDANIQGLLSKAKTMKQPYQKVVDDYLDSLVTSKVITNDNRKKIYSKWKVRAKQIGGIPNLK